MRIFVHIGPDGQSTDRLQRVLDAKRAALAEIGVLYPRSPGARNHSRLAMAVSDAARIDSLRWNRGHGPADRQAALREAVRSALMREVAEIRPHTLILSAHQLGAGLVHRSELDRLRALLAPISADIGIVAHLCEPARMLARHYAAQVLDGRAASLALELGLLGAPDFRAAALAQEPAIAPARGVFAEAQGAVFWLDFGRFSATWQEVFGPGSFIPRALDEVRLFGSGASDEIRAAFGIAGALGPAEPEAIPEAPSAAWLSRARRFNEGLLRYLAVTGAGTLPRQHWRQMLAALRVPGPPLDPSHLSAVSERFAPETTRLCDDHPALARAAFRAGPPGPAWQEADPLSGFRATQYLAAFRSRIDRATSPERPALSAAAQKVLPPEAVDAVARLGASAFAPHNRLGAGGEDAVLAPFAPRTGSPPAGGAGGKVILACMKNEAPYLLEWIAYHRAIGFDSFLVYTNGCEDGTDALLRRLDALGVLEHRDNDGWQGRSPQQHALKRALSEPLIRQAGWIAHIDADEFINIRCGNGTVEDLLARMPDVTNIAMTWRLFGHNGVRALSDGFVIEEFDTCAPKYCPKPHTAWGFKTLFRNIGAYRKISCHRPNRLKPGAEDRVLWANGSGETMGDAVLTQGWRNSRSTVGYDLVQLNHYALRSAESFLVKRQRGRALHVDRAIGLNYWVRMDWSVHRDNTIKRNLPRLRVERDRLLQDDTLRRLHHAGLDWHREKARRLRAIPEFAALYDQAVALDLTETERVAYALALDMES